MPLIVLDAIELREWVGLDSSDTEHDAILERLENNLVGYIYREVGWWFGSTRTVVELCNGHGNTHLWISQKPQGSPPAITIEYLQPASSGVAGSGWVDLLAESGSVVEVYFERQLVLIGGGTFPPGVQNIRVTYDEGNDDPTTETPEDIRQALLEQIEDSFRTRVTTTPGVNIDPTEAASRPSTKIVDAVLSNYRSTPGF